MEEWCTHSGPTGNPVSAVIKGGRFTGRGRKRFPVFGATPLPQRSRKRSFRTASSASRVTENIQTRHSPAGCPWHASTVMSATSPMFVRCLPMMTVCGVIPRKCCCSSLSISPIDNVQAVTNRTGGVHDRIRGKWLDFRASVISSFSSSSAASHKVHSAVPCR